MKGYVRDLISYARRATAALESIARSLEKLTAVEDDE